MTDTVTLLRVSASLRLCVNIGLTFVWVLAACRTIHEPAANPVVWPIFQLLFGP
jgi:hypothetical protein